MDVQKQVLDILDEVLGLGGRAASMDSHTRLLGAVPELDSMGVVAVITTFEERFEHDIPDDELNASLFATVGSLSDFVSAKLAGA
jgi:acyl carrier protein